MQSSGKKRYVSTCISCHKRKQKCDRRYPCNHCTKRRAPEACVYHSPPAAHSPNALQLMTMNPKSHTSEKSQAQHNLQDVEDRSHNQHSTLIGSFGYSEDSPVNTVALLKLLDLNGIDDNPIDSQNLLPSFMGNIKRDLGKIPHRLILDFLVQYFVSDLNWMKQLVHVPSFLTRYQQWSVHNMSLSVVDIEFTVLILRICLYTAQFLPSRPHTIDRIHITSLPEICNLCAEVGDSLAKACVALDWKGSLVRVQHLLFAAITSSCQGRTDQFWEGIASACQAAQKAGIHRDDFDPRDDGLELEKEMRRRVFCSLYILDSHLARQLDRIPFLPENMIVEMLPRMQLHPNSDPAYVDSEAPEMFTERLMQVELARFWNKFESKRNSEYDPTQAEERYDKFCADYLPNLPPAFALNPDTKWDRHLPKLAMQRQILHIVIFDSICRNFRPLLLLNPSQIVGLAPYKQVLIQSQKKVLATAALRELEAISTLHSMFDSCHTRFGMIIFNTFEASVLLITLCTRADFPFGEDDDLRQVLGLEVSRLTRNRFMQAVEKGFDRLQMLAEVSDMAASGARTLAQLLANIPKDAEVVSPIISETSNWSNSLPGAFSDSPWLEFDMEYSVDANLSMIADPFMGLEEVNM